MPELDHGAVLVAGECLSVAVVDEQPEPVGVERSIRIRSCCKQPKVVTLLE